MWNNRTATIPKEVIEERISRIDAHIWRRTNLETMDSDPFPLCPHCREGHGDTTKTMSLSVWYTTKLCANCSGVWAFGNVCNGKRQRLPFVTGTSVVDHLRKVHQVDTQSFFDEDCAIEEDSVTQEDIDEAPIPAMTPLFPACRIAFR